MTVDEGQWLKESQMNVQATAAPPQPTATEHLLSHVRANNDLLNSCLADMRAFLSRAAGETLGGQLQVDVPAAQTGLLGDLDAALNMQTCVLGDMRECTLAIEKLA